MSDDAVDDVPVPEPDKPRRRAIGIAGIAIVLALVALALAAWGAWRLQHALQANDAARQQNAAAIAGLSDQLAASSRQATAGNQRLDALESAIDELRRDHRGIDRRTANLETAMANLRGQQQSGRDTLLLNDAEMLLRTGQQRYELFHDSTGALKAYSQAIEVLAQVQNPAMAPVRASAATEREALAAAAPPGRQASLDTLSRLRGKVDSLALAASGSVSGNTGKPGFWSRVAHSFAGIVRVSRDNESVAALPADTRFARQALAMDLAQAQEALLAFDDSTYRAALQRADNLLAARFDPDNADVKQARADIAGMLSQRGPGPAPQLGGALAQLQSLRASQPPPFAPPAGSTSSGAPAAPTSSGAPAASTSSGANPP